MVEELLDNLPAWNEVLDLMMETEDGGMITEEITGVFLDKIIALSLQLTPTCSLLDSIRVEVFILLLESNLTPPPILQLTEFPKISGL